jgi:hypothetical protein
MNRMFALYAFSIASCWPLLAPAAQASEPAEAHHGLQVLAQGSGYDEWRRYNAPLTRRDGTEESRAEERRAVREAVREAARRGELPQAGDDWGFKIPPPQGPAGTRESRRAESIRRSEEIKQLNRAGRLPVTNEADVYRTLP